MTNHLCRRLLKMSIGSDSLLHNFIQTSSLHVSACMQRFLDRTAKPKFTLPSRSTGKWDPLKKIEVYTTEPIYLPRFSGRGPNGRIWNYRRGGGLKKTLYLVDFVRGGPTDGEPLVEKVEKVMPCDYRTAHIALVASGERKRWILATENMKVGSLIRSSNLLSETPVRAYEGDAYPIGSLPIGTAVNCIPKLSGEGGKIARAAGTCGILIRKADNICIVRMPSKREMQITNNSQVTVGRLSNIFQNKRKFRNFYEKKWLGIRQRSGRWKRKTGRFGKKIRPIKPLKIYERPPKPSLQIYQHVVHG